MALAYDITGVKPANLIVDELIDNSTTAALWPTAGVFYRTGLTVTAVNKVSGLKETLVLDTDYKFSPLFITEALAVKAEIYSYVVMVNPTAWTSVKMTYQALGGNRVDGTLALEITAAGTFDKLVAANWYGFMGANNPTRAPGAKPILSGHGFLETLSSKMDDVILQMTDSTTGEISDLISQTVISDASQDVLLALITSRNALQSFRIDDITTGMTAIQGGIASLTAKNITQTNAINVLNTGLSTLTARISTLQAAVDTMGIDITNSQSTVSTHDIAMTNLTNTINTELVSLGALITTLTNTLNTYTTDISNLDATISTIAGNNAAQDTAISDILTRQFNQDIAITDNTTAQNAHDVRLTALLATLNAQDAIITTDTARNVVQDTDIAANDTALTGLSLSVGAADLTTWTDKITANENNNATHVTAIAANTARNTAQDTELTDYEARISALETTGANVDTTVLDAAIAADNTALATLTTVVTANTNKNTAQDTRLTNNDTAIANILAGGSVNLTLYTDQITSNAAEITTNTTAIAALEGRNSAQDTAIATLGNDIGSLETIGTTFDDTLLKGKLALQETAITANDTNWKAARVINTTQDGRLDVVEKNLLGISNASGVTAASLQIAITANNGEYIVLEGNTTTNEGLQAAQDTDMAANTVGLDALIAAGGGGVIDTTLINTNITANETAMTTATTDNNANISTNTTQDTTIAALQAELPTIADSIDTLRLRVNCGARIISPAMLGKVSPAGFTATSSVYQPPSQYDKHVATDWEVASDPGFKTVIFSSYGDTTNLESILIVSPLNGGIFIAPELFIRVRHYSTETANPDWGAVTQFSLIHIYLESAQITASNGVAGDKFGSGCALSSNGSILAVGAYYSSVISTISGMAYIYDWNGTAWVERSQITASNSTYAALGSSCALSADGSILAVGSFGAVYIFDWNGTAWVERSQITTGTGAANDEFGSSCALSADGSILAVGAHRNSVIANRAGMVYVYDWNGTAWVERTQLTASNGVAGDRFGSSCALSADGSILAVGAADRGTVGYLAGMAYIYDWNGTAWVERTQLTASNGVAGDRFGSGCALSADGSILAVGSTGRDTLATDAGAVYIFDWNGTAWIERTQLTASNGAVQDWFGESCALSSDGGILAVGSYNQDTLAVDAGMVYTYD